MAELSLRDRAKARARKANSEPFVILFVCTGNICRSPLAEQLFAAGIDTVGLSERIRVHSAGTSALTGQGMPAQAAALSTALGAHPEHHQARDISPEMVQDADIVLALAREHRGAVVQMVPRAASRTFTLIEFARLLQAASLDFRMDSEPQPDALPGLLRDLVERASRFRGVVGSPADPESDDVLDPYRRSQQSYDLSAQQITQATKVIVAALEQIGGARA
ncbi:low molecular weight phosphatase family protein [Subtercola sp. Z020]|uniref:arsenate reductase/protein-tyrosine-phosphatase family protein n=1 Tax=Subtercola sp. Z020 TaxID=2080582 RepID=UPI000CE770DF|nr:low molecular weight phosphatase family protein [Subtercola sp. Z020]PPF81337.1 low molecular weight phosphatase family protein [Subtercola sp. Z020]